MVPPGQWRWQPQTAHSHTRNKWLGKVSIFHFMLFSYSNTDTDCLCVCACDADKDSIPELPSTTSERLSKIIIFSVTMNVYHNVDSRGGIRLGLTLRAFVSLEAPNAIEMNKRLQH